MCWPNILRSLEALNFQGLVQILLVQGQSVHRLAGAFSPVAFYSLSNSFVFKADHAFACLGFFFLLPLPCEGCFALLALPPPSAT